DHDRCTLFQRQADGRQCGQDARIAGDLAILDRDVEIFTNQNPQPVQVECLHGQYRHVVLLVQRLEINCCSVEIGRASCRARDWSSDVCSSDLTMTAAPFSSARRMVGSAARMRASLATWPFLTGTLRSSRIRTRNPFRSSASMVSTGM